VVEPLVLRLTLQRQAEQAVKKARSLRAMRILGDQDAAFSGKPDKGRSAA